MTLDLGGVIRQLRSDHVRGGSGRVLTPPPSSRIVWVWKRKEK